MHPVRAKKRLGQHFLNDHNIAANIVQALLEKDSNHPVVEIGPGTGMLTRHLIAQKANFIALDVDQESIAFLKKQYPEQQHRFVEADFLDTNLQETLGSKYNVIGNFPYNISSQIMFRVLEQKENVDYLVGMFQKEVAERIAEKPGSKTYGILSVLLQAFYDIEYLFTVHENVFTPPPKVKSAVIRLTRNKAARLECDEILFKKVVKATFNQRRKTIRNSLKAVTGKLQDDHVLLDKRPEQLNVQEFTELTNFASKQLQR